MVIPGTGTFATGPEVGPGGLTVPGSVKDLTTVWYGQEDGTLVKFGKNHNSRPSNMYHTSGDFVHHRDGPGAQSLQEHPEEIRGVNTSKFHRGFNRRQYGSIRQDEIRKQREAVKEQKAAVHLERRRELARQRGQYNGFNPITGTVTPNFKRNKDINSWLLDCQPTKVQVGEGPSAELQRIGHIQLRDSKSRFYLPHYSGANHEKRQQMMVTEGLSKSKSSSILGVGNSDLSSFGVEDQFSKSNYEPNRPCLSEGLYETTAAGRFTPEKTGVWDMKKEPYGSLMSKLSVSRSQGHLGPAPSRHLPPTMPTSTTRVAPTSVNRGFVAPVSSRGNAMDSAREEVSNLY
ncbi:hypothetical protein TrRE_jg6742 [Triparma retinervis]|uniref:Uncharacterized protein n=1 Tax=Triparma retinervis TaxID=2557542 RepID=A0A9W7F719_9STRA|nr:hypothetical protein TrRE_jg6742 [Triparma retinervis]